MSTVTFPTPEIEFIIGPQVKSGTSTTPGAQWFDENAIARGVQLGEAFPASPLGTSLAGTVSVVQGSRVVEGAGTQFITDFPGAANNYYVLISDADGIVRSHYLTSVEDATHLTLSAPWQQTNATGRAISKKTGDEVDAYVNLNYYDQGLCQYRNYYCTSEGRFLGYARKIEDSWWKSTPIDEGRTDPESSYAPRNVSLSGLMLRAMDGRPEFWPWITQYTRVMFDIWVGSRVTYPGLYFGVRDPGYSLLYAANLAAVHPEPLIRAEFREKSLNAAKNYYARLQRTDGTWRWGDDAWIGDAMQGFHVGLLMEGLIQVHRLTGDVQIAQTIIKGTEGIYLTYNSAKWRGLYYQLGGGWADGTNCETGCGAAALPFPPTNTDLIREARQLNATVIHTFGYAYTLSKDEKFLRWGDDIFDATYSGTDGYRGLASFRAKEYDECYRSGGRWLAWRGGVVTTPVPTPTPTPEPEPEPQPQPPTPAPCSITVNPTTLSMRRNSTGSIAVTLQNLTGPTEVRVSGSDGQVTVSPLTWQAGPTSTVKQFSVRVKRQSRTITFQSPCGTVEVRVNVT